MANEYKVLPVVYCVDTEGPLNESIEATFERLRSLFGVQIEPTDINYGKLLSGTLSDKHDLDFSRVFNKSTLNYNRTISDLDNMLLEICSEDFRNKYIDSFKQGWIYNWFCTCTDGVKENPRQKTLGIHSIFDKYKQILGLNDTLHFHYHPLAASLNASASGTTWILSDSNLLEILCKRIIERRWFPACNRPGFHVTRPDSHWFLEQYIPFDFANQSLMTSNETEPPDYQLGDWRRAPVTWVPYHPSYDDWQIPGNCNRFIARCLNLGTRHSLLNLDEVRFAFKEASEGLKPVLSFTNHDFRDVKNDIKTVHLMMEQAQQEFPDVRFKYTKPENAFQLDRLKKKINFSVEIIDQNLKITADYPTFGIQPFLCFQTIDGNFRHDNLQIDTPHHEWQYSFNDNTYKLQDVKTIGIAANTKYGVTSVAVIDLASGNMSVTFHNAH